MARVLLLEPHPEVCDLLGRIARRLGHDTATGAHADASSIDVVIVEPAGAGMLERAREAVDASGAAVVCVSIYPPSEATAELHPVAYLLKPFALVELERALTAAVDASRAAPIV